MREQPNGTGSGLKIRRRDYIKLGSSTLLSRTKTTKGKKDMNPIYIGGLLIVGIAGYLLGRKDGKEYWKESIEEMAIKMFEERIQEVRDLYEETYRNVLKHILIIAKEEMDKTEDK